MIGTAGVAIVPLPVFGKIFANADCLTGRLFTEPALHVSLEIISKSSTIHLTQYSVIARLAQLVEQSVYTGKVGSSSLSSRTITR